MRTITVVEHVSLDGVMQGPASPDEDRSGGFEHGGWHIPYFDDSFMRLMGDSVSAGGAYLLGRRTYESMAAHWPNVPEGDPFADTLNNSAKYVVSTTLTEPLDWKNSTLLKGDAVEAVTTLKQEPGEEIAVLGSWQLVQTLTSARLVDTYVVMIDPHVLGSGKRLFQDVGVRISLQLADVKTTDSGVILATYTV